MENDRSSDVQKIAYLKKFINNNSLDSELKKFLFDFYLLKIRELIQTQKREEA